MGLLRHQVTNKIPDRSNQKTSLYYPYVYGSGGGSIGGIDSYAKLMLHMDGTNNSTIITDSSLTPKTVTANGNAKISTSKYKFGGASVYLDGSGDYLSTPGSEDFNFESGDFTIDFWVNLNSLPSTNTSAGFISQQIPNVQWFFYLTNTSDVYSLRFVLFSFSVYIIDVSRTVSLNLNTWYHMEVGRSGNNFRIFLDGIQQGATTTVSGSFLSMTTSNIIIGANPSAEFSYLNGYLDEFRISKGIARHTENFTPPTEPYY